jgi:hypothetical protein
MSTASGVPVVRAVTKRNWDSPVLVAGLWFFATLLHVLQQLLFPGVVTSQPFASSVLYLSAGPVLAAFVATAISGVRERFFRVSAWLLAIDCVAATIWLALEAAFPVVTKALPDAVTWIVAGAAAIASGEAVARNLYRRISDGRRAIATLSVMGLVLLTPFASALDMDLFLLSREFAPADASGENAPDPIDAERLWTSQPALVEQSLARLHAPAGGARAAYVISLAADGTQRIFGREARLAVTELGGAFNAGGNTVMLSNDQDHLFRVPLAANSNLDAILSGLAHRMNPAHDLVVLYLTSHGSERAELATDLPDFQDVRPISARLLAKEFERAGIKRRVIIVSACHAGSWIKPLANDDTILIAAARADRSSFGCSDERELTYFGEAFLKADVPSDASLADRFEAAKRTVARWEALQIHSEPQVFVGKHMRGVWKSSTQRAAAS